MKRRSLLTLAGTAAALALTACGGSDDTAGSGGSTEGGLITIIVNDPSNPYWAAEGDAAKAAAEELGYTATVSAHRGDTNTESQLVDTAISNGSVALLLDPANADGSVGAVKKADAAGIPVFLINAEINETGIAKAQLVSNNAQGAALGAQQWAQLVGQDAQYAELLGAPSDNNAATRSNGYQTVLSQYPGLQEVAEQVANWDRTEGHDKMQAMLQANPGINAVISGNDEMALGAIAALQESGQIGQMKAIGGFDGSPDAVDAIKAGTLSYTVLQPVVEFSREAVKQADAFLKNGETGVAEEKQAFDCVLITEDNVDQYTAPFTLSQ
ncbi:D-ribose ABC transporter substrate-binding protein [Kineococcus esterisolvens]|uniref:D-ribose ABC transporter substrate-binding protein n=1 Tax=unclassified Kineococcus TaxID=2621656 RepID=UPI003D7D5107